MSPDPREQPPAGDEPPEHAALSRRVFLSTFSNYVGQIVTIGVWFLLTPFILDRLGATQYGLWVLVASFLAYGTLLDLGVNEAVEDERRQEEPDADRDDLPDVVAERAEEDPPAQRRVFRGLVARRGLLPGVGRHAVIEAAAQAAARPLFSPARRRA